ncbi:hypothetical protein GTW25_12345 [Aliihoeflea aestuarii]|uniref:hypothetical protein n=1 Tax=Aliihoeflea aestuarii TaxID=453840 RepID=UPI0020923E69|nr:hypothetical protein [Aliihoeflea aestuarii]MCO6391820.1 hypothetical protein [Aliihoeflea aestuarii]
MPTHIEPTLDDLLNEPIIRQLMASDGHTAEEIRTLFRTVRQRASSPVASDDDDGEMTTPPAHMCQAAMRAAKTCCLG